MQLKEFVQSVRRLADEIVLSDEDARSAQDVVDRAESIVSDLDIINFANLETILIASKVKAENLKAFVEDRIFGGQAGSQSLVGTLRLIGDSVTSTTDNGVRRYTPRVTFSDYVNRLRTRDVNPYYRAEDGRIFFYGDGDVIRFNYKVVISPDWDLDPQGGASLLGATLTVPSSTTVYQGALLNYVDVDTQSGVFCYATKVNDTTYTLESPPGSFLNVAMLRVSFLDLGPEVLNLVVKATAIAVAEMMNFYETALIHRQELNLAISSLSIARGS